MLASPFLILMSIDYSEHYNLSERLNQEPRIIPSPELYNFDVDAVWSASMDRLAQPLADGTESPFSSRNPLSGHGQLMGAVTHQHAIYAHELNLKPSWTWIQEFRMLGLELADAEYPIINLVFERSADAIASGLTARVPLGTEVGSVKESGLILRTTSTLEISGLEQYGEVGARLNRIGRLRDSIDPGEFRILPSYLSYITNVYNNQVLHEGRDPESLSEAMLRARLQLQRSMRVVTPRDYHTASIELGAQKVNVIEEIQHGAPGFYGDLATVVVYPESVTPYVEQVLLDQRMLGTRLDVRSAEIIPIDGEIDIRIVPYLSNTEAFNVAAQAIRDNVNPPNGNWGDRAFSATIATALENQSDSIYAVPRLALKHAVTGEPLEELEIMPWHLLEVRQSIQLNWLR